MRKVEINFYEDGTEFIDDILAEYKPGLDLEEEEFDDFIYYRITKIGEMSWEFKNKIYDLYELQDGSLYALKNKKTLYAWYIEWARLVV